MNYLRNRSKIIVVSVAVVAAFVLAIYLIQDRHKQPQAPAELSNAETEVRDISALSASDRIETGGDLPSETDLMPYRAMDPSTYAVMKRLEMGLPARPPLRGSLQDLLNDKSTEDIVKMMGHPLFALGEGSNISINFSGTDYLVQSMSGNLILLKLIEQGIDDPDDIELFVAKSTVEQIEYWRENVEEFSKDRKANLGREQKAALMSYDSTDVAGSTDMIKARDIQYSIPASLFVLTNIDSLKATELATSLISTTDQHFLSAPSWKINEDFAYFAIAAANQDDKFFDQYNLVSTTIMPTAGAVMSSTDPVKQIVDLPKEKSLALAVPNTEAFENLDVYDRVKIKKHIYDRYINK